jgi:hypothetical protein
MSERTVWLLINAVLIAALVFMAARVWERLASL